MGYALVTKMQYDRQHPTDGVQDVKDAQAGAVKAARLQIQESSWYLLLDMAQFLEDHLLPVLEALKTPSKLAALPTDLKSVATALNNTLLTADAVSALQKAFPGAALASSLGNALGRIQAFKTKLEEADQPYNDTDLGSLWPDFIFPLVEVARISNASDPAGIPSLSIAKPPGALSGVGTLADQYKRLTDSLRQTILTPLLVSTSARLPAIPLVAQTPLQSDDPGWFIIRCVFNRPNCLPAPEVIVSEPTQPFQMAGFFDPDAPARPIRIALPVDTSPAGLRKFNKNTAFMISDLLCGQIKRAKGLGLGDLVRSVLPWPLHKDLSLAEGGPCEDGGINFGMICSLSIPIITICALILLMIIVSLLDMIFRWIPYFILCFPLPKFEGKGSSGS
jgi:hypothetical protein